MNYKNVLIIGNGESGKGASFALDILGIKHTLYDPKDNLVLNYPDFDLFIVSPGINKYNEIFSISKNLNIPVISEIELGYMICNKPIIAITGTNGKTTTTSLITNILALSGINAISCGNIGVSFSKCVALDKWDMYVVEVSSFQLENIKKFRPNICVITSLHQDHLNRYDNYIDYINTKLKIAKNQTNNDYLMYSGDDIDSVLLKNFSPNSKTMYYSSKNKVNGVYIKDDKIYFHDEFICRREQIRLQGEYNLRNALASICVAKILNIHNKFIINALSSYSLAPHRFQIVDIINGISYINDSKATNIDACMKAINECTEPTCLILCGGNKNLDYDILFNNINRDIIKRIHVCGSIAPKVLLSAKKYNYIDIDYCKGLEQAVYLAHKYNVKCVLLSPSSDSFDSYSSYIERGNHFIKIVKRIRNETK